MAKAHQPGHPFFTCNLICYLDRTNISVTTLVMMKELSGMGIDEGVG
jgi:hypothetical protein